MKFNLAKICINCHSDKIRGVQIRKNIGIKKQIYLCIDCNRRFTLDDGFKKFRHSPTIIKTAIELTKNGSSLSQVANYLLQNFKVKVSRKTIFDWKKRFLK